MHAWFLRSDRAWLARVPFAILELVRGWFRYVPVTLGQPVLDSIETRTRFYREILCCDVLYEINYRRKILTLIFAEVWTLTSCNRF